MHRFFPNTNHPGLVLLCVLSAFTFSLLSPLKAYAEDATTNQILSIVSHEKGDQMEVRITGSSPLVSTIYELPNPTRIVVDIADAKLGEKVLSSSVKSQHVTLSTREIADAKPAITRLEFILDTPQTYTSSQEGNDLVLIMGPAGDQSQASPASTAVVVPVASGQPQLQEIKVMVKPEMTVVQLLANVELADYSKDTLENKDSSPPRLYIDLNNIAAVETLLKEQAVKNSSLAKVRVATRGSGLRIVFDSAHPTLFPFKIQPIKNGLEIVIEEGKAKDQLSALINQKKGIEGQLPDVNPLDAKLSPQASEKQMQDAFNFSGYNKERITVEFQKMDLHNVFNFLRQVSGVNIVVDESVQGSLTLVLDDVPWDFALDIILNLKNLEKEERFNTLVIYPKGKGFIWPKQAENNLSFETDSKVVEQESLLIKQQEDQPLGVVEAKQIMTTAREAEKREDFETAVRLYEKALEKWTDNTKLANKIASIYLVQLHQNAKAVFFAKRSLEIDPKNSSASLNAAIASANMHEKRKAQDYFEQCVNVQKPSKESLQSFAVFNEEQLDYTKALKILEKHDALYGNDLNTMVTAARIYDKMGKQNQATEKYQAILSSGFRIPQDLMNYIKGRVAMKQAM